VVPLVERRDRGSVEGDLRPEVSTAPNLKSFVPRAFNTSFTMEAYRDSAGSKKGPFPVLLAELRAAFGIDTRPIGLGDSIVQAFPGITMTYKHQP
jgi:hypothetical protein